ncbi:MAG TPA: ABC transporter permease [Acidimicrobiales bacterium]|nr:ABC transporter permease [Acidimicrobiales bacterium]
MTSWAAFRLDLARWRRARTMLAAALIPPLAMGLFIWVLTLSVGRQPVALVVDDHGPQATLMANIFTSDQEAYALIETNLTTAASKLASQQVAAVIVVPPTFDRDVERGTATVDLTLNNVDIDFGDDIRRAVARSVAQFDAPFLGFGGELAQGGLHAVVPNPYRVAIAETTLRKTNVGFLAYEIAPVLLLVVLSVGTLGIGWLTAADIGSGAMSFLRTTPATGLGMASGRLAAALGVIAVIDAPLVAYAAWAEGIDAARIAVVCALVILTGAVGIGLGLVVALLFRRPRLVAMASTTLCSYLFFLGGGFTTIAFLPSWLQTVSAAVPTSYAIDGLRQVLFYAQPQHMPLDLTVLGAVAVVSVVIAAAGMRRAA